MSLSFILNSTKCVWERLISFFKDPFGNSHNVVTYWIANPEARTIEVLVLKADEYHSLGIFRGKATLPSRVLPDLPFPVEQFFRDD